MYVHQRSPAVSFEGEREDSVMDLSSFSERERERETDSPSSEFTSLSLFSSPIHSSSTPSALPFPFIGRAGLAKHFPNAAALERGEERIVCSDRDCLSLLSLSLVGHSASLTPSLTLPIQISSARPLSSLSQPHRLN